MDIEQLTGLAISLVVGIVIGNLIERSVNRQRLRDEQAKSYYISGQDALDWMAKERIPSEAFWEKFGLCYTYPLVELQQWVKQYKNKRKDDEYNKEYEE